MAEDKEISEWDKKIKVNPEFTGFDFGSCHLVDLDLTRTPRKKKKAFKKVLKRFRESIKYQLSPPIINFNNAKD